MVSDAELVRHLQECAARAQPAEHVVHFEGWWLRYSASRSWWLSSVLPHGDASGDDLLRLVEAAERFSAANSTRTTFQLTPGVCPAQLDKLLAGRSFERRGSMSLQTAPVAHVMDRLEPPVVQVEVTPAPDDAWLAVWADTNGADADLERELLGRLDRPAAYASAVFDGKVVAVGRTVIDSGWAGIFGMATLPAARGRRAASAVLARLASYAREQGRAGLYLQVERDNQPAMRLYQRSGFSQMSGYHYRQR